MNKTANSDILNEWKNFIKTREINDSIIGSKIKRSWERCFDLQLNPYKFVVTQVPHKDLLLRQKRHQDLIDLTKPFMEHLFTFIENSDSMIVLTDEDGIIIDSFGDKDFVNKIPIAKPGTSWNEMDLGTNGVGTALKEEAPIQIIGSEHYYKDIQIYTCSASPIHDISGKIIGCLDISSLKENAHFHTLGMVVAAVKSIENQIKIREAMHENIKQIQQQAGFFEVISEGIFVINDKLELNSINATARVKLGISENDIGRNINDLVGSSIDFSELITRKSKFLDKEAVFKTKDNNFHCNISTSIIEDLIGNITSLIVAFKSEKRIYRVVNKVSGSHAFINFSDIIGDSYSLQSCLHLAKIAGSSRSNVLLLGESGTGKEMFAQSIHNAGSRSKEPFIAVNCGAIPRDLIQSELFGYEAGAFTGATKEGRAGKFELADGGTIFLDEIGDMPLDAQVSLLRVLQNSEVIRIGGKNSKKIDVRIIAATHQNLHQLIEEKLFRSDLYYRLNVLTLDIPSLKERNDDIPLLSRYFLNKHSKNLGKLITDFSETAMETLQVYDYPGNVRELENIIERAVNISQNETISLKDLPYNIIKNRDPNPITTTVDQGKNKSKIFEFEKNQIIETLIELKGNMKQTAKNLGLSRATIYYKIKKFNINPDDYR